MSAELTRIAQIRKHIIHLGPARAQSKNLSREIDRVNAEATQLKADIAAARIETEASNREARENIRALQPGTR